MAKPQKSPLKPYPEAKTSRIGCKVAWNYYTNKRTAERCAKAARHNGRYYASLGYDFGYCEPGSISKMTSGEFAKMYEVCLP